jgi:hypothetical protein
MQFNHLLHVVMNDILPEEGRDAGNIRLASTAYHKFIRGCHYRGMAVKQSSKSVNWLLDFANIGSKPGVLSPHKLLESPIIKRPPNEPPPHRTSPKLVPDFGILTQPEPIVDKNGNAWRETSEGDLVYCGKGDYYPSHKEFLCFISKTGVAEDLKDSEDSYYWLKQAWTATFQALFCRMEERQGVIFCAILAEGFVDMNYIYRQIPLPKPNNLEPGILINGLEYPHDNTVTQVVCAYILDYWHNHRELHKCLRQCRCCGKLWLDMPAKNSRGGKKKYCCVKCENRFNQASRQVVKESLRKQRKIHNKDVDDIACDEIKEWLHNKHKYKLKDIGKIIEDEALRSQSNIKSFANFKRTYGKRNGLA